MEATATDDFAVEPYCVNDVTALLPLLRPAFDQLHTVIERRWFELDPRHPRPKMLEALFDGRIEEWSFVGAPPTQGQSLRLDEFGKDQVRARRRR